MLLLEAGDKYILSFDALLESMKDRKNAAIPLRIVVINERLPSDDLDPPLSPEKLTGDAALLLKINEFEHDAVILLSY